MDSGPTDPSVLLAKNHPNPQGVRRRVPIKSVTEPEGPAQEERVVHHKHTLFLPHLKDGIGRFGTGLIPQLLPGGRTHPS
jgi:hypothetical protein